MKNILIAVVTMLAANQVYAESVLSCFSPGSRDGGYSVTFFKNKATASVDEMTLLGGKHLATLNCHELEFNHDARDAAQPIIQCVESETRDAGYSVVLTDGDMTGHQFAILSEISIVGSKELVRLPCRLNTY